MVKKKEPKVKVKKKVKTKVKKEKVKRKKPVKKKEPDYINAEKEALKLVGETSLSIIETNLHSISKKYNVSKGFIKEVFNDAKKKKEKKDKLEEDIKKEIEKQRAKRSIDEDKKDATLNEEQKTKEILKQELKQQEIENYKENSINWLDNDFYDSWDKIKGHCKNLWGSKKEFTDLPTKWFFLSNSKDTIKGKPQIINNVMRKLPLVRKAIKTKKEGDIEIQTFYFFDEKFDKRHDGFQIDAFALDFWMYRIITNEGKEYYVLTENKLPNCTCEFKGMCVEIDDFAEISRSMKLKSLSRLFFMRTFEPDIKILSQESIVEFTKSRNVTSEDWLELLSLHPNGNFNKFPDDAQMLKSAWFLSGKFDGYPLHLGVMGKAGTKKSCGYCEAMAYKLSDELIFEGTNGRLKGLIPSFKETPASIGYLLRCERAGFVDEIGKMIEFEMNKHQSSNGVNILGELNPILDNKKRLVGSGNNNELEIEATAKFMFVSNKVNNRPTINAHVGLIDTTTMSRILWWGQDAEETEFVLSEKGLIRVSPNTFTSIPEKKEKKININNIDKENKKINNIYIKNKKKDIVLNGCWGEYSSKLDRNEVITLFDSCYSFVSNIDYKKVEEITNEIELNSREPMKTSVWKPRGFHHTFLLIDGICKHRCLFSDYDNTFTAKEEDYELAKKILMRAVKSWNFTFPNEN